MKKGGYVYIMASLSRTLYIGVTNNLERRLYEHKTKAVSGFSAKYNCSHLVYFEETDSIVSAIEREKQLKRWSRKKKVALIEAENKLWQDLAFEWFDFSDKDLSTSSR